jgi:hypothetical protein
MQRHRACLAAQFISLCSVAVYAYTSSMQPLMHHVQRTVVKATLKSTLRNRDDAKLFEKYVSKVQQLTKAAYLLVFSQSSSSSRSMIKVYLESWIGRSSENFLKNAYWLWTSQESHQRKENTKYYWEILHGYLPEFRKIYLPAQFLQMLQRPQQTCIYQGRAILDAYLNNYQ